MYQLIMMLVDCCTHDVSSGDAAEPPGCMELVDLACKCLDKKRKKRPAMTEVSKT